MPLTACGGVAGKPVGGSAAELSERGATIITLAAEEPLTAVKTVLGEVEGKRLYQATFYQFGEETTCRFTVEETGAGARIAAIAYLPEGLRPMEPMVCPEGGTLNPST